MFLENKLDHSCIADSDTQRIDVRVDAAAATSLVLRITITNENDCTEHTTIQVRLY